MFIELLIVAAILLYLNTLGILSFDSPYAIAVSIAVLVTVGSISFLVTHWIASKIVDSLFGFGSWSPKELPKRDKVEEFHGPADNIEWLEAQIRLQPENTALSIRLSDLYQKRGMVDEYVAERLRIVATAKLTAPEMANILNRLADLELDRDRPEIAVAHLELIANKHPATTEGRNALTRIGVIQERIASRSGGSPE